VEVRPIQSNLDGHIRQSVEHIQTTRELIFLGKKACALERACITSQDGAIGPIFEGDMPLKNDPEKWCR
jgi:hypothetical protein